MSKNEEEESKNRRGQRKSNLTNVNKQQETEGKTKADDFADRFPNFSILNEEERCAFFKALTEARKNVERRGVPTRERFGTIHDEYLKYYNQEEQEETQVQSAVVTLTDSPLHGDSITPPLDRSPTPEEGNETLCEGSHPPTLLLEPASEVNRQEPLEVTKPGPWEVCESVIREESDKMVDLYLKKVKKTEETPRAQTAIPRLRARVTPRFDALNAQEKDIFFRTLREAHESVVRKNPGKESDIPTMNAILDRYRGDRQATPVFRTEPNVNLKVRVTLTSGDNERLERMKPLSPEKPEKPTKTQRLKSEDFEPEIIKEKSDLKTVLTPDKKKSDEEENLCQPDSSVSVKDSELLQDQTYNNNVQKTADASKSTRGSQEKPRDEKPTSASSVETKPKKKKPIEATTQKGSSLDSIKARPKGSSLMSAALRFKSRSKDIKDPNQTEPEDKLKKPKKEKKPKKTNKKKKKPEDEIEIVEAVFENESFDQLKCGMQDKDENTKKLEKLCRIESSGSECSECATKCDAQVSSVLIGQTESFKGEKPQEEKSPPKEPEKKKSLEEKEDSMDESTRAKWKDIENEKSKKEKSLKRTSDEAKSSKSTESLRKDQNSDPKLRPGARSTESLLSVEDLESKGSSEKRKPIIEKKDSLELRKQVLKKEMSKHKENPSGIKSTDTIASMDSKERLKKNKSSSLQSETPIIKLRPKREKNLEERAAPEKKNHHGILKKEGSPRKESSKQEMAKSNETIDKKGSSKEKNESTETTVSFPLKEGSKEKNESTETNVSSPLKEDSKEKNESTETNLSSPLKESPKEQMESSVVAESQQSIEGKECECECDSTCLPPEERKLSDECSCSVSSLGSGSCGCLKNLNCDLPRELSVHNLNTISTSAVKSLVFGSWSEGKSQKAEKEEEEEEEEKPVPGFTSGKVMLVDDNVVDRIRKLIYYLDAKVHKDDPLEKEYMRLLVDYTEYLSRVLEFLVSRKVRSQVQNEFTAAEARLQFHQPTDKELKNKTRKKSDPKAESKPDPEQMKIPRSVSEQNLHLPRAIINEKTKHEKTKDQSDKHEVSSPNLSDSGSSSDSEGESRFTPLYSGEKNRIITTKIRMLQDILQERAEFVEGSIMDYKIVYHPEQDYVPPEKHTSAQLLADDEEEQMQQNTNKFLKRLMRLCSCGRKKTEDDGVFENLKGEAVRVDVYDNKERNAASATLNPSTMEVLKASERKKMIEKYYKKA